MSENDDHDPTLRAGLLAAARHAAPKHAETVNSAAAAVAFTQGETIQARVLLERAGDNRLAVLVDALIAGAVPPGGLAKVIVTGMRKRYPQLAQTPAPQRGEVFKHRPVPGASPSPSPDM